MYYRNRKRYEDVRGIMDRDYYNGYHDVRGIMYYDCPCRDRVRGIMDRDCHHGYHDVRGIMDKDHCHHRY